MASENETVEAAIAAVRKMIHECPAIKGGLGEFEYQLKANGAIDRIESACRREKAELDRKVADALTTGAFVAEESARKPRRNCDTVADFHDAKRKFKDVNAKGPANYCRRLCHWLLAPVAEGGES